MLRGELDWIVMKALDKDRTRRYETAAGMAADVQRYMDDEPVVACPPSAVYRVRKFARRNKVALAVSFLVGVVIVFGITGLAISTGLIWSANIEAERQANRAEQHLDRVLEAVDDFLWRVGESGLDNVPAAEGLRKKLLEDALTICQSLIDEEGQSPQVQLRSAGRVRALEAFTLNWVTMITLNEN